MTASAAAVAVAVVMKHLQVSWARSQKTYLHVGDHLKALAGWRPSTRRLGHREAYGRLTTAGQSGNVTA
jgi:hypothetical protein